MWKKRINCHKLFYKEMTNQFHLMSFVKIIQNSEKIKCIKQYNEKKFFAENLNPYMCNQGIPEVSLGKASYLRSHKRKDELYLYTK